MDSRSQSMNSSQGQRTLSHDHLQISQSSLPQTSSNTSLPASTQSPRPSPAPGIPNGKPASPFQKEGTPVQQQSVPQSVISKDPKAAAAAANDMRNVVRRKLTGYVGFANLPNQWHRKSVRKGFSFNVMVVGMLPAQEYKWSTDR